jgi:hypothetical protein
MQTTSQIAASVQAEMQQISESDAGWAAWDEFYADAIAMNFASTTATVIAVDEMTRAGWVRVAAGWKRV